MPMEMGVTGGGGGKLRVRRLEVVLVLPVGVPWVGVEYKARAVFACAGWGGSEGSTLCRCG